MTRTRVLIVEDSATVRLILEKIVAADPRLAVVASVTSAETLLARLPELSPDVISLDIRLPGMNGLEATLEVMQRHPTPIVIVAADVNAEEGRLAMQALRAGALAVVEKPVGVGHAAYDAVAKRICDQLFLMSKVKVVRQTARRTLEGLRPPISVPAPAPMPEGGYTALGIVASTGGPMALVQLLNGLGLGFPIPILLVQHIGPGFVEGFGTWLESQTPFRVRLAEHGCAPEPGTVHLAPAERHLLLGRAGLELSSAPALAGQRPSGTMLLSSIAGVVGARGLGVVLTGMGSDGAEGLRALHRVGGYTLAEDVTTAVVYGMPGAAAQLGAVRALLPLPAIAPRILELAGRPSMEMRK